MAIGGHFYTKENFSDTLRAIALEHCMGVAITNTEHPTAPLVLFKLLEAYSRSLKAPSLVTKGKSFLSLYSSISLCVFSRSASNAFRSGGTGCHN